MDKAIIVDHLNHNSFINNKQQSNLKNVQFAVQPGELVSIVDTHGFGATSILKILSGTLLPSSGFVSVLGFDPAERSKDYLKEISVVFAQKNELIWDLPVIQSFELNKLIYEIPDREYRKKIDEIVPLLNCTKLLGVPVKKLTESQLRRVELVAALLHNPKILFLDEIMLGLDMNTQQLLRDFIYEYNKNNQVTILVTSKKINDISDLARRVIILDHDRVIFDGVIDDIFEKYATDKIIKATLSSRIDPDLIKEIGTLKRYAFPELYISVPRTTAALAAAELLQNYPVSGLSIEEAPIDEALKKINI